MCSVAALAQQWVTGRITDAASGEPLPAVSVYYDDAKRAGVAADKNGNYRIRYRVGRTLVFNFMGFESVSVITNRPGTRNIKMREASYGMQEVVIESKRRRYSRKNNPAVEMMRRVVAAKSNCDLDALPYYTYRLYEKQTCSVNEFMQKGRPNLVDSLRRAAADTTARADSTRRSPLAFLLNYAERCEATGKTILPLLVEEKVKERVHRAVPRADKTYVLGQRSTGINDLISLGGELNTVLADVFQDINIYDNDIRLFQRHFMSPIADHAIGFYRYYIEDTLYIDTPRPRRAFRLTFTPNNPQDFGFSGELVVEDSTWQVHTCEINIPSRSGVNFVDDLRIIQQFATLADGRRVLTDNDMVVQMSLLDFLTKVQVQRTTRRTAFAFDPVPDSRFRGLAKEMTDPDAELRDTAFWALNRPMQLTLGEQRIDSMVREIERIKGFKVLRFLVRAYGEDFIELRKGGGPVDIGPMRKLVSHNSIEGLRLLVGGQTTARLSPHWYLQGYAAYGFGDRRWKGKADLTYSFNRKKYRPHEFPVHSLSFTYMDDLMSMSDRKLGENRSDMLSILEWGRACDYKTYQRLFRLNYTHEWANGLLVKLEASRERLTPAGDLVFRPMAAVGGATAVPLGGLLAHFSNTAFKAHLRYQPGNTYVNSKKHRHETNKDAPIYEVSHTVSPGGLWGNTGWSNTTDFELYRRLWLSSWGRMDFTLRGAWQWNTVPFIMLNSPDANKSYIMMRRRFCLMNEMEFLNDHNLSLHWKWDLAGKLFNRIPLLRRLKWRETIGFNMLWGELSDKNNPERHPASTRLWQMPGTYEGGVWTPYSYPLDPKRPYMEVYAGVFNILKFFNVTYVHRLNYLDHADAPRWGVRFGMEMAF